MTPHHLSTLTQLQADAHEAGAGPAYRRALAEAIAAGRVELAARVEDPWCPWALGTSTCSCCGAETTKSVATTVCGPCEREARR